MDLDPRTVLRDRFKKLNRNSQLRRDVLAQIAKLTQADAMQLVQNLTVCNLELPDVLKRKVAPPA